MIDSLAGAVEILQASPTIKVHGLLPNYPFIFSSFWLDPYGNSSWVWAVFFVPLPCA